MSSTYRKPEKASGKKDPLRPDLEPPGGVYLCQVSGHISCGACCGLYNVADPSPDALMAVLARRTERFRHIPRNPDAITAFKGSTAAEENPARPIKGFHHCPFIGLVGPGGLRVGCLLHPRAEGNHGVDFRWLSHYGSMACYIYFCPAHTDLPARFKHIVRAVAGGWYLYGAVITESGLINALFEAVEKRLGQPLAVGDILDNAAAEKAAKQLLRLKLDWPYTNASYPSPVHYFFKDSLCPKPVMDYQSIGARPPKHPALFQELASCFQSPAELSAAEVLVDDRIDRLTTAIDTQGLAQK